MAVGEEQMNVFERTLKIVKKERWWTIIKSLLLVSLLAFIMCSGIWVTLGGVIDTAFKRQQETKEKVHSEAMVLRREAKPKIDALLTEMRAKLGADRAFILEMHNGTSNTAGLPFLYAEMTYECVADSIDSVDEDYVSLNLSRFAFAHYFEKAHMWCNTIEELEKVDAKLAKRLAANDVTFLAMVHIHGVENTLGYLGITYCNGKEPHTRDEVMIQLMSKSQMVSTLLDMHQLVGGNDK